MNILQELLVILEDTSANTALKNKSDKSGIALSLLKIVYDRGLGAWNSSHRPGVTQQAWGMARVNSFISGNGGARKADNDVWQKHQNKK